MAMAARQGTPTMATFSGGGSEQNKTTHSITIQQTTQHRYNNNIQLIKHGQKCRRQRHSHGSTPGDADHGDLQRWRQRHGHGSTPGFITISFFIIKTLV